MNSSRVPDCRWGWNDGRDPQDEEDTRSLVQALKDLLDRLTGTGTVADAAGPESTEEGVESWEGGGYFYLEAALPSVPSAEIEVIIQGGRAYIRMAR